jgi:hypothetical protein
MTADALSDPAVSPEVAELLEPVLETPSQSEASLFQSYFSVSIQSIYP